MIALFPGKFQPPHLGHVLTIVSLYDRYERLLVGVTEDNPAVMPQEDRVETFRRVFQHMPRIEVVPIAGTLIHYESLEGLPEFDICLTGNPDVIEVVERLGRRCEFVARSEGSGYSGTEQRTLMDSLHE